MREHAIAVRTQEEEKIFMLFNCFRFGDQDIYNRYTFSISSGSVNPFRYHNDQEAMLRQTQSKHARSSNEQGMMIVSLRTVF